MALTDTAIKAAKPRGKAYKLADEKGLHLHIAPNGGKWWRFRYRLGGREKMLSLGVYPDVGLAKARERRDAARKLVSDNLDPSSARKAERAAQGNTFKAIAQEWLGKQTLAAATRAKAEWVFDKFLYPDLGAIPIASISAREVLTAVKKVEARGKHETAHRAKGRADQVFRYAVANGLVAHNPVADLRDALAPVEVEHHAAVTDPRRVGELLRALDGYTGQPSTAIALRLAPLVFPASCAPPSGPSSTSMRRSLNGASRPRG
jgi:hypothetical protein